MDQQRLAQHKLRNGLQSLMLVGAMAALCGYLAWLIGGAFGAWLALTFVVVAYALNPAASPRLVMGLFRATPIHRRSAPRLYAVLEALAERASLPVVPTLYYLPSRLMNAFTTGQRDNAAIAVSDGLLRSLDLRQLTGVLGHEMSHIAHDDTRVMAFADLTARVTGFLSVLGQVLLIVNLPLILFSDYRLDWLPILLLLAAPVLSTLVQLALSRNREFEADRNAAELTGDPEGLASALNTMEHHQGRVFSSVLFPGQRIPDPSILRTHPPSEERIRRLLELRDKRLVLDAPRQPMGWVELDPLSEFLDRECGWPCWHRSGLWY